MKTLPQSYIVKVSFLKYLLSFAIPLIIIISIFALARGYPQPISTLLFMGVVILSSWYFGLKAGIMATIVSAFISTIFIIPPYSFYSLLKPLGIIEITSFICEGFIISYAIDSRDYKSKILEYRQLQKNLRKRILELEIENEITKKEIKSRDEFLSIASHELKTPLTSMLLQTQHAIHSIKNVSLANFSIENLLRMLESAEGQTKRLSRMINDLLNVSLITTGNMQLEFEEVNLNTLVKNVLNEFSPRIDREKYEVKLIEQDRVKSHWDKIRIEQAFSNMVSNALKYGNHKPITVTVKKNKHYAKVLVADMGMGIAKEKQKKIFELFERGGIEKEWKTQKGLGVGLYITRQITHAHGGDIEVSSKVGKGSVFTMLLPLNPHIKTDRKQQRLPL
ncbi:MAG: ATP-binding protein [Candidatus Levyibacteriota bacterium]